MIRNHSYSGYFYDRKITPKDSREKFCNCEVCTPAAQKYQNRNLIFGYIYRFYLSKIDLFYQQ